MAKSSTKADRTNTGNRGAKKTKLSRLELALMGKGPSTTTVRQMRKAAEKGKR